MRIIISSESYVHPIIIQKGVMSVRWDLRIVSSKKIIIFCYIITRLEAAEWTRNYHSMFSDVVQSVFSYTKIFMIFIKKVLLMTLNSAYECFVSGVEYKIQGFVEAINYQQTEISNIENYKDLFHKCICS